MHIIHLILKKEVPRSHLASPNNKRIFFSTFYENPEKTICNCNPLEEIPWGSRSEYRALIVIETK